MRADAQALLKSGVELTPGQSMGGFARWAEEAAKKIPILNQFIRSGERNSIGSFNNAVLNQALEPIGRTLPEVIQPGHDAFRYAERQFNNAYGTLLPNMRFNAADPDFLRQAADIAYRAQTLGRDGFEQYQEIARQRMARFIQQTPMPGRQGQTLKDVESELRQEAEGYQRSSAAGERNLGNYLGELHRALMDSVKRQNPNSADLLDRIDSGYAMFATARDAANRGAIKEGVFMPSDLLNIIKQKAGKNQFARGDALLQTYAETAQRVLPGKMPDSGTPERLHAFDIASAAGGAPFIPFYLRPVTGASLPTANEQAIREYLRTASPYVGTGIEPILQRMLTRQQNASQ
jgi:hypothetical protein